MSTQFILSLLVTLAIVAVVSGYNATASVDKNAKGSDFMYLLAYSWTPGFCNTQSNDPGCSAPQDYWKNHFTLHGLWPQYYDTGYPSFCTDVDFDAKYPEAVGMDTMTKYWPNVQAQEGTSSYDDFWEHEWTKHGTCSTLDEQTYFQTAIDTIEKYGTPSIVTENVGGTLSADDIRNAFGGKQRVALKCSNNKYLVGAYTCWSQKNGIPQAQIDCNNEVVSEDTCHADDIEIQAL